MTDPIRHDELQDDVAQDEAAHDDDLHDVVDDEATRGPGLPPPTAVESLVNALLESGPDVAEHVVRAAQELIAAAQVVVDAADRAVREQQEIRLAAETGVTAETDEDDDAPPVPRLDLAE